MKISTDARVGPKPGTDEWYAMREAKDGHVVFGASEAAAACGLNPYMTPLGLYMQKRGDLDPIETNAAMRMGLKLEPVIISEYELATERKCEANLPSYLHAEYDFMSATPDAVVKNGRKATEVGVECKSVSFRMINKDGNHHDMKSFGQEGTDQVPAQYLIQAQQQMEVLGWVTVDIPVLVDGRDLKIYTVPRNEQIIDQIVRCEADMADRIRRGDPPAPDFAHAQTSDLLQNLYPYEEESSVVLDEDVIALVDAFESARSQERTQHKIVETMRNKLLDAMGAHQIGMLPNGRSIKRTKIPDSYWTTDDAIEVMKSVGDVKRKGHERISVK